MTKMEYTRLALIQIQLSVVLALAASMMLVPYEHQPLVLRQHQLLGTTQMDVLLSGIVAKSQSLPARMKKCVGPTLPMDQLNTQAAAEFITRVALLGPQTVWYAQHRNRKQLMARYTVSEFNVYYHLKYLNYEKKHTYTTYLCYHMKHITEQQELVTVCVIYII